MAVRKVKPFVTAEPTKISESKAPDTQALPVAAEILVDEKYCAENHVPVWSPEDDKDPATPYVQDEAHNLPTLFDPDVATR